MHANAVNVITLLTVAASVAPALAAPVSTIQLIPIQPTPASAVEQRSAAAIGKALADGAVEGLAAGGAAAAINAAIDYFNKRDAAELDARSLSAISNFFHGKFGKRDEPLDARSLSAIGNFFHGKFGKREEELDARSLSAIGNFFHGKFGKREFELEERSAAAIGKALADGAVEGLASGAAGAAIGKVIDRFTRRDIADLDARSLSAIEDFLGNIFKREFELEERSGAAIGKAIAAGLGSGALEGAVTGLVNKFTRDLAEDVPGLTERDLEERSGAAIGKAIAAGLGSGALEGAVTGLVNKFTRDIPDLDVRSLSAIEDFLGNIFKRELEERSGAAIGKAIAAGLGSGALEGAVTGLVNKFTRDVPELDARSLSAIEERSGAAIGKAIAGSAVGGAIEGAVTGLVNKFTGRSMGDVFIDDSTGIIYADVDEPASEKRAVGAIVSGLVTGTGSGILRGIYHDLTDRSTGDMFIDDSTGIIYADVDAAVTEKRAIGAVLKGLASGTGGGILKGIYNDLTDRAINELD